MKRNLVQFGIMVYCMTGRFALDYNNYGSYCGVGGSGTPVDDVDRYLSNSHKFPARQFQKYFQEKPLNFTNTLKQTLD